MSKPLGFVSKSGIISAGVLFVLAGLWTGIAGPTLFSPGPLSAKASGRSLGGVMSHAQTRGACGECHAEPWDPRDMAAKCIRCHAGVDTEVRTSKGLHGRFSSKKRALSCRSCHREHLGPHGVLTLLDASFPHDLTGFSLRGHERSVAGSTLTCGDCHGTDLARFDQVLCARCHSKVDTKLMAKHETMFGTRCVQCHNGAMRSGSDFDHGRVASKLTGAHARVKCSQCHTREASSGAFKLTTTGCQLCHPKDDIHGGKFGTDCGRCHGSTTWTVATLDHGVLSSNPALRDCYLCHGNNDTHQGSLGRQCDRCHDTVDWNRAVFTHSPSAKNCFSCHAKDDRHGDVLDRQCGECHRTSGWSNSAHTRFPINHGGAQGCVTCHPNGAGAYSCYGCHVHSQAMVLADHSGQSGSTLADCIKCHAGAVGSRRDGQGLIRYN